MEVTDMVETTKRRPGRPSATNPAEKQHRMLRVYKPSDADLDLIQNTLTPQERTTVLLEAAHAKRTTNTAFQRTGVPGVMMLVQIPAASPADMAEADRRIEEAQRVGVYRWDAAKGDFDDSPIPFPVDA